MILVDIIDEPGSKLHRAAAVVARLITGILVLAVIGAFVYDVVLGSEEGGGLVPVFFVGSVPLAVVATMDIRGWRRLGMVAGGLPLLLFGAITTLGGLTAGNPDSRSATASFAQSAVAYLLVAALGSQIVLVVLAAVARRRSPAVAGVAPSG